MLKTHLRRSSGNVLFMIMIAIVLIAALTYAITRSDQGTSNLTLEKASIASAQISSMGLDMKRAVENMTRAGTSEAGILFAHTDLTGYGTADSDPEAEIFNIRGGGVAYQDVPAGVNDGSQWEFTGATAAPGVGDDATPDLVMVVPNVKETFCHVFNKKAGYTMDDAIPTDSGACVFDTSARYDGTFATGGGINTMDSGSFRATPAPYACVACGANFHVYYVLLER